MPLFEADEETEGIVIYTEPGGRMEAELARWKTENDSRLPIVAFMAGKFMDEMPGMSFGHAGTIVEGKEDTATEKIARLEAAGITVAEEISQIPELMKASHGMRSDATFIGIEVDDAVVERRRPRRQARGGLPRRHLRQAAARGDRRAQHRRVHPLRPVHPGLADGRVAVHKLYSGESLSAA